MCPSVVFRLCLSECMCGVSVFLPAARRGHQSWSSKVACEISNIDSCTIWRRTKGKGASCFYCPATTTIKRRLRVCVVLSTLGLFNSRSRARSSHHPNVLHLSANNRLDMKAFRAHRAGHTKKTDRLLLSGLWVCVCLYRGPAHIVRTRMQHNLVQECHSPPPSRPSTAYTTPGQSSSSSLYTTIVRACGVCANTKVLQRPRAHAEAVPVTERCSAPRDNAPANTTASLYTFPHSLHAPFRREAFPHAHNTLSVSRSVPPQTSFGARVGGV